MRILSGKAFLTVMVLTLLCCASCKKDKETEMVTLKLALEQPTDPSNQKVYLDGQKLVCWYKTYQYSYGYNAANNTYAVTYTVKELIRINDLDSCEVENNTAKVPTANTYTAVYPHRTTAKDKNLANNGDVTVTIPAVQKYIPGRNSGDPQNLADLPMGAYLDPSESGVPPVLMFRNLGSLIKVKVENPSADYPYRLNSIKLSSTNGVDLHGTFTWHFSESSNKSVPTLTSSSSPAYGSEVMLDFNHTWTVIEKGSSREFYIVVAPFENTASSFRIEVRGAVLGDYPNNSIQHSEAIKVRSKTYSGSETLARSRIGKIEANLHTGTGYDVSGGFNVGSKQSYFSIANLMIGYNELGAGTWYFRGGTTPEQYDIEGPAKSWDCWSSTSIPYRASLAMDLFWYLNNNTLPNDPRITAPSVSTYFPFALSDVYSEDLSSNIWRCPSRAEYNSILFDRSVSNSLNARYAKAKIGNKAVLILFPDDYQQPDGVAIINIDIANANYDGNPLTYAQWKLMEAAGAIVLPTTGQIANTNGWQPITSQENEYGTYWTSDYIAGNPYGVYLYFNTSTLTTDYGAAFYAIRLIRD